jgi:hypothetical protein
MRNENLQYPVISRQQAKNYGYTQEEIDTADQDTMGILKSDILPTAHMATILLSNSLAEKKPEILNRSDRRIAEKFNPVCKKCGISYSDRFNIWTACTVNAPPALVADGHKFFPI